MQRLIDHQLSRSHLYTMILALTFLTIASANLCLAGRKISDMGRPIPESQSVSPFSPAAVDNYYSNTRPGRAKTQADWSQDPNTRGHPSASKQAWESLRRYESSNRR